MSNGSKKLRKWKYININCDKCRKKFTILSVNYLSGRAKYINCKDCRRRYFYQNIWSTLLNKNLFLTDPRLQKYCMACGVKPRNGDFIFRRDRLCCLGCA